MKRKFFFFYIILIVILLAFPSNSIFAHPSLSSSLRIYGADRYKTAVEISKYGWASADNIILARGDDFPDALSAVSLAAKYNAPILLTRPNSLDDTTIGEMFRLFGLFYKPGAKHVIILGSADAVSPEVVSQIEERVGLDNASIHRLGGASRYDTTVLIGDWLDYWSSDTAVIATGENFPDALAVSPLAGIKKMPIILVKGTQLSSDAQNLLKKLKIDKTIIVGGADVVSAGIENWLKSNGYSTLRFAGRDRYNTAKTINDYAISPQMGISPQTIFINTGENFPDALSTGSLAVINQSILTLTASNSVPSDTSGFFTQNKSRISNLFFIGGQDVITEAVKKQIEGYF